MMVLKMVHWVAQLICRKINIVRAHNTKPLNIDTAATPPSHDGMARFERFHQPVGPQPAGHPQGHPSDG
jgi:hypothetical protein